LVYNLINFLFRISGNNINADVEIRVVANDTQFVLQKYNGFQTGVIKRGEFRKSFGI